MLFLLGTICSLVFADLAFVKKLNTSIWDIVSNMDSDTRHENHSADREEEGAEGMRQKRDPFRALNQASLYAKDEEEPTPLQLPRTEHLIRENDGDDDTITVGTRYHHLEILYVSVCHTWADLLCT